MIIHAMLLHELHRCFVPAVKSYIVTFIYKKVGHGSTERSITDNRDFALIISKVRDFSSGIVVDWFRFRSYGFLSLCSDKPRLLRCVSCNRRLSGLKIFY